MMSGLGGDVVYPLHVINGRDPPKRDTIAAKPGQRVRLRLINAGSDTAYRVAVGGHRLTVTHGDVSRWSRWRSTTSCWGWGSATSSS